MVAAQPDAQLLAEQARQHPALWPDEEKPSLCAASQRACDDRRRRPARGLEGAAGLLFSDDWCAKMHAELMATLQAHRSYQRGRRVSCFAPCGTAIPCRACPPRCSGCCSPGHRRLLLPRAVRTTSWWTNTGAAGAFSSHSSPEGATASLRLRLLPYRLPPSSSGGLRTTDSDRQHPLGLPNTVTVLNTSCRIGLCTSIQRSSSAISALEPESS